MKLSKLLLSVAISAATFSVVAQVAAGSSAPAAAVWKYKVKHLQRGEIDELLAHPQNLLVLDVRRPDELIKYGSFPAFVSIQAADLPKYLAYLPTDRVIVTVSNHAGRAGAAGDFLVSKGYTVAGAAGSEEYEKAGGENVKHIRAVEPAGGASAQQ